MKKTNLNKIWCVVTNKTFLLFLFVLLLWIGRSETKAASIPTPTVNYRSHVQEDGWQSNCKNGETSGTIGKGYSLQCIEISLSDILGDIEYQTYLQDIAWTDYVMNGQASGTIGQNRPIEAIRIRLTGEVSKFYDIYYRVYIQSVGWLGWTSNNQPAGSTGCSLQMEAIEIKLLKKGTSLPSTTHYLTKPVLSYKTHVSEIGWQNPVNENEISGTTGRNLQVEALIINLKDIIGGSGVEYRVHMQDIGWSEWTDSENICGTTGQNRQIEAVQVRLKGVLSYQFDILYRTHIQDYGWLGWAKNGEKAGTEGGGLKMEGV